MEVLTIESSAFKLIKNDLQEIKDSIRDVQKNSRSEAWLSNKEAAAMLKVSSRCLQSYRDEGKITFSQIGAKIYYRVADIDQFLLRHTIKAFSNK